MDSVESAPRAIRNICKRHRNPVRRPRGFPSFPGLPMVVGLWVVARNANDQMPLNSRWRENYLGSSHIVSERLLPDEALQKKLLTPRPLKGYYAGVRLRQHLRSRSPYIQVTRLLSIGWVLLSIEESLSTSWCNCTIYLASRSSSCRTNSYKTRQTCHLLEIYRKTIFTCSRWYCVTYLFLLREQSHFRVAHIVKLWMVVLFLYVNQRFLIQNENF